MVRVVLSFLFFRIRRVFIVFCSFERWEVQPAVMIHSWFCGKAYGALFSHDVPTRVAMLLLLGDLIGMVVSCSV